MILLGTLLISAGVIAAASSLGLNMLFERFDLPWRAPLAQVRALSMVSAILGSLILLFSAASF